MLPVSSSPLERWRATLLKAQNTAMRTEWQQNTLPFGPFLKENVLLSAYITRPCRHFHECAAVTAWSWKIKYSTACFSLLISASPQFSICLPSWLPQPFKLTIKLYWQKKSLWEESVPRQIKIMWLKKWRFHIRPRLLRWIYFTQ